MMCVLRVTAATFSKTANFIIPIHYSMFWTFQLWLEYSSPPGSLWLEERTSQEQKTTYEDFTMAETVILPDDQLLLYCKKVMKLAILWNSAATYGAQIISGNLFLHCKCPNNIFS